MSRAGHADFVCRIDAGNTIVEAGDCWLYLLHQNSLEEVTPPPFLGKQLWSHLRDTTAMHLYEALITRVRRTGKALSVPCCRDLPGRRLHLEMRLLPLPAGGVEFRSELLREETVPEIEPPGRRRLGVGLLRICGWCKRIPAPDWLEAEVAVRPLRLLEADEVLRVTHSICPQCAETVIRDARSQS